MSSSVGVSVCGDGRSTGGPVGKGAPEPMSSSVGRDVVVGDSCGGLVPKTAVGAMGALGALGTTGAVGDDGVPGKGAVPPLTTGAYEGMGVKDGMMDPEKE